MAVAKQFFCLCLLVSLVLLPTTFFAKHHSVKNATIKNTPQPEQVPYYEGIPADKLISSYPYITGFTFRSLCTFIVDCKINNLVPNKVRPGDTIFLSYDRIELFFNQYYSKITAPFILVTHHCFGNGDASIPGKFAHCLENKNLIAWFTINTDIVHPKVHPLPLGIANAFYPTGDVNVYNQLIEKCGRSQKTGLLYLNFVVNTDERQRAYDYFKDKDFCTIESQTPQREYLSAVAQHRFVLSPRGGGIDCYRTWEALLMGSIPIVRSSAMDKLFEDLPVVVVREWSEVTREFLEQKCKEISGKLSSYTYEKLFMHYWISILETHRGLLSFC